jgi:hypothetical protein
MDVMQVSIIVVAVSALTAITYFWYDIKLRNTCIRRLDNWQRR